jgi:hypothetical protein
VEVLARYVKSTQPQPNPSTIPATSISGSEISNSQQARHDERDAAVFVVVIARCGKIDERTALARLYESFKNSNDIKGQPRFMNPTQTTKKKLSYLYTLLLVGKCWKQ